MKTSFSIRQARLADAPALALLATELGYQSTVADIERRLPELLGDPDNLVIVAADAEDHAVGWLHALVRRQLEIDPFVQVAGLVVAASHRSAGIGARLLTEAERWAVQAGVRFVRLRCNVTRDRAHAFYLRAGYTLSKTSHLFIRQIAPEK